LGIVEEADLEEVDEDFLCDPECHGTINLETINLHALDGLQIPDGLVVRSCTSHARVLDSFPKRKELGKTGAPCLKVPGSSRLHFPAFTSAWWSD